MKKKIRFEKCHQKKNKLCLDCRKIIWQSSSRCGSCANRIKILGYNPKDKIRKFRLVINPKYTTIHSWIHRQLGKASKCSKCEIKGRKRYHWANISRQYKRDYSDWISLCVPCHYKYDRGIIDL